MEKTLKDNLYLTPTPHNTTANVVKKPGMSPRTQFIDSKFFYRSNKLFLHHSFLEPLSRKGGNRRAVSDIRAKKAGCKTTTENAPYCEVRQMLIKNSIS